MSTLVTSVTMVSVDSSRQQSDLFLHAILHDAMIDFAKKYNNRP